MMGKIREIVKLFARQAQEIEDVIDNFRIRWGIDTATGDLLDQVGKIVQVPRMGRSDTDYRAAIKFQVYLNHSSGTPETIIEFTKFYLGAGFIKYEEIYPCHVQIQVIANPIPSSFAADLQGILVAGVKLLLTASYTSRPFIFLNDDGSEPDIGEGFSELSYAETAGGQYAELLS